MRVLVVEDYHRIAAFLQRGLEEEGYAVDVAGDGEEGLDLALSAPYDLLVLDIILPKRDGLSVCRELRSHGNRMPILMLTARDAVEDRITGLDAGADDDLTTPFAFGEFLARVRALVRRGGDPGGPELRIADLALDPARHELRRGDQAIPLPLKEFAILEYLLRQRGRVATRTMIAEHVWGYDFEGESNVIDVHIRSLRRKLDDGRPVSLIETVRGVGYRIAG